MVELAVEVEEFMWHPHQVVQEVHPKEEAQPLLDAHQQYLHQVLLTPAVAVEEVLLGPLHLILLEVVAVDQV